MEIAEMAKDDASTERRAAGETTRGQRVPYSRDLADTLLERLGAGETMSDICRDPTEATRPLVTSQQLDNAIDEATKTAELREQAIDNKVPNFPPWISPLLSLAALICAIVISRWNRPRLFVR
jgi:hypothetical protein